MQAKGHYWLPEFDRPIIGFDFDQTISVNGHDIILTVKELFYYLEKSLGFMPVIISGRSHIQPQIIADYPVITIHQNPEKEQFESTFNPIRFKIWVLLYYLNKGDLLFYVEGDNRVVEVLNNANIPVVNLKTSHHKTWVDLIGFWIKFFTDRKPKDK